MKTNLVRSLSRQWLLLFIFTTLLIAPVFAGEFNLIYEQVITDSYGNELGYRRTNINSPDDLPYGSPWREYLNLKLPNGSTIFEYSSQISSQLSQPFNLTLSNRSKTCNTGKTREGYNINMYDYVNNFASDESKSFIFMHEFGHVAMLNAYPSNYAFKDLDYGSDNKHYLDEILPNTNTAWIEGWANAFAAQKGNGKVFSMDLKKLDTLAFLKDNTFDEMVRNELFVGKVLYDSFNQISSGQSKVFDTMSLTGPHSSLQEFCQGFVSRYPNDKVALAEILIKNSHGKISLNEILAYVNNGSRTVTRELYNYLAKVGMVSTTNTTAEKPRETKPTTQTASIWDRIASFFAKIFGYNTSVASAPSPSKDNTSASSSSVAISIDPEFTTGSTEALAPELGLSDSENGADNIAEAQEAYYKAFAEYNAIMSNSTSDREKIIKAQKWMLKAKARIEKLRKER